jgi:hypothetical protein
MTCMAILIIQKQWLLVMIPVGHKLKGRRAERRYGGGIYFKRPRAIGRAQLAECLESLAYFKAS